jgi:hypothetical protein
MPTTLGPVVRTARSTVLSFVGMTVSGVILATAALADSERHHERREVLSAEPREEVLDAKHRLEVQDAQMRSETQDAKRRTEVLEAERRREVPDAEQRHEAR